MKQLFLAVMMLGAANFSYAAESVWDKPTQALDNTVEAVVYRSPSCGCCGKWLTHLEKHGFKVIDHITGDVEKVKAEQGVGQSLASCHTAIINGYVVEGHVPADDIKRMLLDKPKIKGLTVPGMVAGSPGMEMGERKMPFDVLAFDKQGKTTVYHQYKAY